MKSRDRRSSRAHWPELYADFRASLIRGREEAGMTQRDAAEALGRPQSYVAKSETGERRVDVIELLRFAEVYAKPVSFFLPASACQPEE